MANAEWDAIDKFEQNAPDYYCAFLDILGYKAKSEEFFAGRYNLKGRFERAVKNSLSIFKMTSLFIDHSTLKVVFFSDSIVITAPVAKDELYKILLLSAILSAHLSMEDMFIRGGISAGPHIDEICSANVSFTASEALKRAYLLEQSASNPRVVVDPAILGQLSSAESDLLLQEGDKYILHYSGQLISRGGDNVKEVKKELIDIRGKMFEAKSDNVREKYRWILDYYCWSIASNKNWNYSQFKEFASGIDRGFQYVKK